MVGLGILFGCWLTQDCCCCNRNHCFPESLGRVVEEGWTVLNSFAFQASEQLLLLQTMTVAF